MRTMWSGTRAGIQEKKVEDLYFPWNLDNTSPTNYLNHGPTHDRPNPVHFECLVHLKVWTKGLPLSESYLTDD